MPKALTVMVVLIAATIASEAEAGYWTSWVSEENGGPPVYCSSWSEAARGVGCSGSYSDNVRLYCDTLPNSISLDSSTDYWSYYFSDPEGDEIDQTEAQGWFQTNGYYKPSFHVCNPFGDYSVMSGIRCHNSYCDNVSIECTVPKHTDGTTANHSQCGWTSYYSDENGSVTFNQPWFISGIRCSGNYCDNMSYFICQIS